MSQWIPQFTNYSKYCKFFIPGFILNMKINAFFFLPKFTIFWLENKKFFHWAFLEELFGTWLWLSRRIHALIGLPPFVQTSTALHLVSWYLWFVLEQEYSYKNSSNPLIVFGNHLHGLPWHWHTAAAWGLRRRKKTHNFFQSFHSLSFSIQSNRHLFQNIKYYCSKKFGKLKKLFS